MNEYVIEGFDDEIEKIASFKKNIPWALSRGLTGAGSTVVIGLAMNDVLKKLKKRQKDAQAGKLKVSKVWDKKFINKRPRLKKAISKAEAVAPLALVGGTIGIGKGFAEKGLERAFKKMLKLR